MNCASMLCKKPIDDDSVFCKYCGARQAVRPRTAPVKPQVAPSAPVQTAQAAPTPPQVPQTPQAPVRHGAAAIATGQSPVVPRAVAAQEASSHAPKIDIPEPPRFDTIPEQPPVVLPANPTPATDFFIYAGTLKIYKGNSDVVVVPDGVTSIGSGVFRDHQNLKEIYLPEGITALSSEAFAGCSALVKINLPEGITSIGPKAFMGCSALTNIIIPRSCHKILDKAFQDCVSLQEIYLHDTVTTLSYFAFQNCKSLSKIRMPSMLLLLCEGTFQGCTSLRGIELHEGLKNIERHAFANSGLEYIVIPLTVINIEEYAFSEMPALQGITVPKITKIDNYTFVGTNLINKGTIRYIM